MTQSNDLSPITVENSVNAPIEKVWKFWTEPGHIIKWNSPSPDWHTPEAENDVRTGGTFRSVMAAKDGSMSFEFAGNYLDVKNHEKIEYQIGDGRKVKVTFKPEGNAVKVVEV